ncbi:MAG: TonB-dependent receptor [Candidatus Falkowbacteria bacterium]|nr:TonB-dependent receptor [Candidatus Falkowbacteria bacterium]
MKQKLIGLFILIFLSTQVILSQNNTQQIRGTITDKVSKTGLVGAIVFIVGTSPPQGTSADINGNFKIDNVTPGRYDIKATFLGYKEVVIPNVLVTSGKQVVLDIELEENYNSLNEVVIAATKNHEANNEMSTISSRVFSMEEVNRYSGGMGDPARLASNFAGVVTPNDQRNDLVIRGNSPTGVLWRIDGLNVPNLNHFSTLGSTGGPISALNTNVLKNSDFMTSAFAPEYGNATAGVFDIGFRKGNSEKREHTFQFGAFTGLELMTEGPINKEKGSSYMIAYRYSFTGLAQAAGFSIGTAANPQYQDIAFKIAGGKTKLGTFSLFGLGGTSKIAFKHDKIDSTDVFADPSSDSYSKSTIGLLGVSHLVSVGSKSYFKTVLGGNYSENSYNQDTLNHITKNNPGRVIELASKEAHYTLNSSFNSKINSKFNIKVGVIAEFLDLQLSFNTRQFSPTWTKIWDFKGNTLLLQEYVQAKYALTEKFSITGGLHSQQLTLNNSKSYEPRLAFKYQVNNKNSFTLGYGWHEQMQALTVYFYESKNLDGTYNSDNKKLGFSRAQHIVFGYDFLPASDWRIKTEVYTQLLSNIPIADTIKNSFSILNEGASFVPTQQGHLVNKGAGTNYGVELTLEKFFTRGYYGLLTASVYQSKYKGSDNIERNTAFNGRYTFNFLAGKEFKVGRNKQNAFTIDTKFTSAGGRYYTPVDLFASQQAQQQILQGDSKAYTGQLPNYYRWDLKFGFRYNSSKRKISHSIFFDLQNLTNQKNVFARQYNKLTNNINTTYQNGFLPNFVYKVQF